MTNLQFCFFKLKLLINFKNCCTISVDDVNNSKTLRTVYFTSIRNQNRDSRIEKKMNGKNNNTSYS